MCFDDSLNVIAILRISNDTGKGVGPRFKTGSRTYSKFGPPILHLLADGSVVTWGHPNNGGDCSPVEHELKNVHQIMLQDVRLPQFWRMDRSLHGAIQITVVTAPWFKNSSRQKAQKVEATDSAFAAILADGTVITWDDADCGSDCSPVEHQLQNVQQVQGTGRAFAAILANG